MSINIFKEKVKEDKIKIIELFGGIGAASQAIKRLYGEEKIHIVDYIELDKKAVLSYNAINSTNFEPTDINDIDMTKYSEVDIMIAGWPCQDYSVAGLGLGLDGTRSSLILLTISKIKEMIKKPKYILLENVKGLLSKKHINDLEYIKELFNELGYNWNQTLLNSKYFGVPQSRERVYILLSRKDLPFIKINHLEERKKIDKVSKDILDFNEPTQTIEISKINESDYGKGVKNEYTNYIYLPPNNPKKPLNGFQGRRLWKIDNHIGTICTGSILKIFYFINKNIHYRKISTLECWRLMGFNDESHNKLKLLKYLTKTGEEKRLISDSQLYKQAGNSIVVNVLEEIFKIIFKDNK